MERGYECRISGDCYFRYLAGAEIVNTRTHKSVSLTAKEFLVFNCFLEHTKREVSLDTLARHIWGSNYGADKRDPTSIKSHITRIRKKMNEIEPGLGATLRTIYRFTDRSGYTTYTLEVEPAETSKIGNLAEKTDRQNNNQVPPEFTLLQPFLNESAIIHRDSVLSDLSARLKNGKVSYNLWGFGGTGKTSVARVLYTKSLEWYECRGWVSYQGNLRDSLLRSVDLNEKIEGTPDTRWKIISNILRTDPQKKILFIDNVDSDFRQGQNPEEDSLLQEITGWPNISVILTSRKEWIPNYTSYELRSLSPDECVDLFNLNYYNSGNRPASEQEALDNKMIVQKLVEYAGWHTYTIELLARSARRSLLKPFLENIQSRGFQFPALNIQTFHSPAKATLAEHLKILYDMCSRSVMDQEILWNFSILPEGCCLSAPEVDFFLGYCENDLDLLCSDGWIEFRISAAKPLYTLHPLIKQVIHLELDEPGKAPAGIGKKLISLVTSGKLICEGDDQRVTLFKLSLAESIEKYVALDIEDQVTFMYCLGMAEFKFAHKFTESLKYLRRALHLICSMPVDRMRMKLKADILYDLGYIESATFDYRDHASETLRQALNLYQVLGNCVSDVAKAYDHLGYVLSDRETDYREAEQFLRQALLLRSNLQQEQQSVKALADYATTCDNLGCLLCKQQKNFKEGCALLEKAYSIREELYRSMPQYANEAAWSAYNLGRTYATIPDSFFMAEKFYRCALEIRLTLQAKYPNTYAADVILTLTALAKHLSNDPTREDELFRLCSKIIDLYESVGPSDDFFSHEVEENISSIRVILSHISQNTLWS